MTRRLGSEGLLPVQLIFVVVHLFMLLLFIFVFFFGKGTQLLKEKVTTSTSIILDKKVTEIKLSFLLYLHGNKIPTTVHAKMHVNCRCLWSEYLKYYIGNSDTHKSNKKQAKTAEIKEKQQIVFNMTERTSQTPPFPTLPQFKAIFPQDIFMTHHFRCTPITFSSIMEKLGEKAA